MNTRDDVRTVERLAALQSGVFHLSDLRAALAEPHRAALYRRIERMIGAGVLRRFASSVYITASFDLAVLSQRIAPDSTVSFETVLARELVIGPRPAFSVSSIRGGRSALHETHGYRVAYHHIADELRFGESAHGGVRTTDPEKAMLDVLTFHLRGRRALFDLRGDVELARLDQSKLDDYLSRYRNSRFVAFARGVLRLP
jgi:hypothetical protein